MTKPITMGLRFTGHSARVLRNLAEQLRSDGAPTEAIGLFDRAADAAKSGEPLLVICEDPAEVELMADGFVRYGVKRPAVEHLQDAAVSPLL